MTKISRGRLVGLLTAGILLLIVGFGGFSNIASTEAAWSDERTLSATFEIEELEVIIPGSFKGNCAVTTGPPPNDLALSWTKPTNLEGHEVEYLVSWRLADSAASVGQTTMDDQEFSLAFDELEVTSYPTDLEFIVEARVKGNPGRGSTLVFTVKVANKNGTMTCLGQPQLRTVEN